MSGAAGVLSDASSFSVLELPEGAVLERDEEAPLPFAVWLDGDIIGAGHDPDTAIQEARASVREWNRNVLAAITGRAVS